MSIAQIRLFNMLYILTLLINNLSNFCWYIIAIHLSLEILNSRKKYLQQYKTYNFICWSYSLVLLERFRVSHFSLFAEWVINCTEHLLFGVIICIKVYIYTAVFTNAGISGRQKRAIIACCVFNCIGILNEIFQNSICKRSLLVFIPDSIKDIEINLLGTAVFAGAVLVKIAWLQQQK